LINGEGTSLGSRFKPTVKKAINTKKIEIGTKNLSVLMNILFSTI